MSEAQEPRDFEPLLDYLRRTRGFDFTAYKRPSLMRRMQKRMQSVGIERFTDYMDYLEVHPDEFSQLFNSILINVTAFFRDESSWDLIRDEIVPLAIGDAGATHTVRVWSAGCASGEETYSIAMLLAEALGRDGFRDRVKIYATDVDDQALGEARSASYSERQVQPVPPDLLERYFVRENDRFVFDKDLRRSVIFGRHDLIQDAPISRVNILICRNTLMYFNTEAQNRILARFHFALCPDGALFLGKAEMLFPAQRFTPHRPAPPRVQEDRQGRVARPVGDHESGGRGRHQQRLERADVSGGVRRRATCADRVRSGRRPGDGQRIGRARSSTSCRATWAGRSRTSRSRIGRSNCDR